MKTKKTYKFTIRTSDAGVSGSGRPRPCEIRVNATSDSAEEAIKEAFMGCDNVCTVWVEGGMGYKARATKIHSVEHSGAILGGKGGWVVFCDVVSTRKNEAKNVEVWVSEND